MRKSLFILYFILQTICSSVFAQSNYPIYVTPTLTPPYSLNLSDYSQFGSQKLMVTIHANDLDISNLPIKLRIKLETVGVTIENPPTLVTTPIYVNGGETTILYGRDLLDYFNIDNLIFRGYSKNDYTLTGQLPEGFYKFTVEVLHFNTNRLISNQGSASAWFALGKPPLLKLPENNAEMGKFKGMPLSFSWLSSNVGSPVSANTIQYKFEMWEMHVPGINPNTVALTMPVFHEYTTLNTVYTLYPDNLLMTPGMQYAWRITASDLSGYVPFEQNGHSEIRTFVYKAACDSITNLESSHRGRNGYFSWEPKANHTSFNVEIQNPETNWISNSETFDNKAEFFDLDYGTTYQMRVQAVCDGDPDSKSDFSEWKTLKIPVPEPPDTTDCPDCACDNDMPDVELQNFELRKDLQPGDILSNKTGTSRFIIKTVEEQGDGVYEGIFLFWAEIWNIKFICNYWDLQVNTDNVIVNMDFESIYDPQFLVDVDATFDYLDSIADVVTTLTEDVTPDDTLTVDGSFETIYVNEGDSVIIVTVDDDGNITEEVISDDVDEIEEFLIEGEDGEEYVVTRDGQVMDIDEYRNTGGGNSNKIDDYNEEKEENELSEDITVDFKASSSQKYGFDKYNEEKSAIKNEYPSFNNGYTPTYKSIASFGTDLVGISNTGENIIFKDEMGIPAIKSGEDLTLRGSVNGSDVALYAYQVINDTTEKIAGKLNVLSFDQQYKRLYIVPVNGATVPDETALQEVLNKIYGQAVTRWEVTKLENLDNILFENENMTHGGTSAISVYNSDQKTIVNTFEERVNALEKNAYYLFFVENVTFKERSIAGYMPLQYQVGFIYDNPNLNIIAHELSHGAFNLYHTFSPKEFIATEHTTENLMDYKGGTELWKHQWDKIHNPEGGLYLFQDEDEAAYYDNCTAGKPTEQGSSEGEYKQTQGTIPLPETGSSPCFKEWYYHIAEEPYEACCDENGELEMVEPEYETGWYKAETFAEINRHIIIALGILNGDIHCLHNERSIESAEYTIEEFFSSKSVSASFMQAIQDDYEEVCSDYKRRCSGSGMITPTYLEFDIALELTAIGIAKDIIHLLRINRIAKLGARKLVFQGSKLMDDAGEVIARYSDDALRELKFIDEGGEVIGLSDDVIRYADENGKLVEEELALIKKDGKLGFRRVTNVLDDPSLIQKRTNWLDELKSQHDFSIEKFEPQGLSKDNVPQSVYDDMLAGYSDDLSPTMKEEFLNDLIKTGSDVPVKNTFKQGDELYKIVPKGKEPGRSAFYMKKSEFNRLKNSTSLEQELGLPLGSHSVQYDVYKATAKQQVDVFESTVASTIQDGYKTTGGATQSLILNTDKWNLTKLESIMPSK